MHLTRFFRFGWFFQLLVGLGLFAVSLIVEGAVLQAFFATPALGLFLAAALETGKATAIIWHRYLTESQDAPYPLITRMFSQAFRFGLLGLSVLCSLLYLGVRMDRPNLPEVRAEALRASEARLDADLKRLAAEKRRRLAVEGKRRQKHYEDTLGPYQRQVEELEALLRKEMDNAVGGRFKGPRYRELERRLEEARKARDRTLVTLSARQSRETRAFETALEREMETRRARLLAAAEKRRKALQTSTFAGDERVEDPHVVGLIRMAASVFDHRVTPLQFVFAFSLFISLLMEFGIVLAFDTLTLTVIPALAAQHREEVMNEALLAEVEGHAARDDIRHREAMERIRRTADRTFAEARAAREAA